MKGRPFFEWAIGVLVILVLIGLGAVVLLFVGGFISLEKSEQNRRQLQAELDSGRWDFGDQLALFAVAQGIVKNDPEAINFAVRQSWQRPESVDAVRTLLSLGADPNYTNGNRNSFAMANAGIRRRPSSAQCWRQREMRILAMSLVGQ